MLFLQRALHLLKHLVPSLLTPPHSRARTLKRCGLLLSLFWEASGMEYPLGNREWPILPLFSISEGSRFCQGQCSFHGLPGMLIPDSPCQRGSSLHTLSLLALDFNMQPPAALTHLLAQVCDPSMDWLGSQFSDCPALQHTFSSEVGRYLSQWLRWDRQFPCHIVQPLC